GADPARNGEPFGEMGLVNQKDTAWHAQTGPPSDPQAGNTPGTQRDVLRTADLTGSKAAAFYAASGTWSTGPGGYTGSAPAGLDAVTLFYLDQWQPSFTEILATAQLGPTSNQKNAFIVFDYLGPTNFKYAGLDA